MKFYSIDVRSWTASFRYPNLISGVQPSLEIPPLSTVLGLINAAAGRYLVHKKLSIGYYFEYQGKGTDIETIYMMDSNQGKINNNAKSNVIKREFLFDNFLRLYSPEKEIIDYLTLPVFPLLLGRMNDLATVNISGIVEKELTAIDNADKLRGQIVPFANNCLPGIIQALPKYFTDTIPRRNIGTEPYSILNHNSEIKSSLTAYRDIVNGKEVDIYIHELNFEIM